jgi:hypothetical protein
MNKQKNDKKKLGPLFWVAFAALIILNLSVFIDYQKPLERYQQFVKVEHRVKIKAGEDLENINRHGEVLPSCKVVNDGTLTWLNYQEGFANYEFNPLVAASPGKSNENAICQAGDKISVNARSEDNANTVLILLSINFDNPLE